MPGIAPPANIAGIRILYGKALKSSTVYEYGQIPMPIPHTFC